MKIICGFSHSTNRLHIFSWLIKKGENRPYSHTYIGYICPITNEPMIFQASKGLVNCFHRDNFLKYNKVVKEYTIECTQEQFKEFYTFKCKNLGKKYSKYQIVWFFIKKLFQIKRWPDYIYNLFKNGDSEFICSEVAAISCGMLGIIINNDQLDQISPSDLDKILEDHYEQK